MTKRYAQSEVKRYVLDTSVFLFAPHALRVFEENTVIIPRCVLSEMMALARNGGEHRMSAIEFGRELDVLLPGPGCAGELDRGGTFSIMGDMNESVFNVAQASGGILVSRDPLVRTVARTMGITAEPFKFELADFGERPYAGRCVLYVSPEEFQDFSANKILYLDKNREYTATDAEGLATEEDYSLTENEYVVLSNSTNANQTLLGRYTGRAILPLRQFDNRLVYGVRPRNAGERFALDALMDPDIPLVILKGPAGTAKSFLSMAAGLEQTLETSVYNRILITRPNTKMDDDVGFLK